MCKYKYIHINIYVNMIHLTLDSIDYARPLSHQYNNTISCELSEVSEPNLSIVNLKKI